MSKDNFFVKLDGTDQERTFKFKHPTYKETIALDMEYRRAFSEAVRGGVMTTAESVKSMKKTEAWTDEDDAEISRRIIEIADKETTLQEREGTPDELHLIATSLTQCRNELLQEMNKRTELFENTAEGIADQCRIYKMIYYCVMDEHDNKLFDTDEEFEQFTEQYPNAISYIYRRAYFFQYDVDDDIGERWEEVKYLNERAKELQESIQGLEDEQTAVDEANEAAATETVEG